MKTKEFLNAVPCFAKECKKPVMYAKYPLIWYAKCPFSSAKSLNSSAKSVDSSAEMVLNSTATTHYNTKIKTAQPLHF